MKKRECPKCEFLFPRKQIDKYGFCKKCADEIKSEHRDYDKSIWSEILKEVDNLKQNNSDKKQKYFYIVKIEGSEDSVPNYVYPEFRYLYDIMETPSGLKENFGRILVNGDFFVSRKPYQERFFQRQKESLEKFKDLFEILDRPSEGLSDDVLKDFEGEIFAGRE